jgi:hypothetical protein
MAGVSVRTEMARDTLVERMLSPIVAAMGSILLR